MGQKARPDPDADVVGAPCHEWGEIAARGAAEEQLRESVEGDVEGASVAIGLAEAFVLLLFMPIA